MKNISFIFFIVLFSCCSSKQQDLSINKIEVNLDNLSKISFFDLFSDIEIIPLETTDVSVMSAYAPDKFILHNNRYYCLDQKQKSILIFDENGKFLKKFKKEGRGPGEYTTLDDFTINQFTGNLELMSSFSAINIYDSLGLDFKEKISLPGEGIIHYMANLSEDKYVFYSKYRNNRKIFFYSKSQNKVLADTYEIPDVVSKIPQSPISPFYIYNNSVFFLQSYDGEVFEVSDDLMLKPRYSWDFGKHTFDISTLSEDGDMEYYNDFVWEGSLRYPMGFCFNIECDKYYISRFNFKKKSHTLIYNKENQSIEVINKFTEGFPLYFLNIYGNSLYMIFSADEVKDDIDPILLDDRNREKLEAIEETDNPVLVKYNLK